MGDTTMTEYTPTTEQVRARYAARFLSDAKAEAEWGRWLRAHDAKVAANALREASNIMRTFNAHPGVSGWLADRADRIERKATNHKPNPEETDRG